MAPLHYIRCHKIILDLESIATLMTSFYFLKNKQNMKLNFDYIITGKYSNQFYLFLFVCFLGYLAITY